MLTIKKVSVLPLVLVILISIVRIKQLTIVLSKLK